MRGRGERREGGVRILFDSSPSLFYIRFSLLFLSPLPLSSFHHSSPNSLLTIFIPSFYLIPCSRLSFHHIHAPLSLPPPSSPACTAVTTTMYYGPCIRQRKATPFFFSFLISNHDRCLFVILLPALISINKKNP